MEDAKDLPISPALLKILRDPLAVQNREKYGDDPGRLTLVHNCWLVSEDTGLKYPITEGIPVMLIEEGEKWKETAIDDLPVPPPSLILPSDPVPGSDDKALDSEDEDPSANKAVYVVPFLGILGFVFVVWRLTSRNKNKDNDDANDASDETST